MTSQLDREYDLNNKSSAELFIWPEPIAATPELMSEQEAATRMSTVDIVERFSTSDKYNAAEQKIIGQAIEILASKLVSQDAALQISSGTAAKNFLQLKLATSEREIFAVMFLDNQHRVIAYEEMFIGTIDAASVYPREIIKSAINHNAAALILSHNHPSGELGASIADDRITNKIGLAAEMFNIRLLDHIIVSPAGSFSYAEHGKMPS